MVDFPSSSDSVLPSSTSDVHFQRPPHLPFRRISLPSVPNLHRQSVVSTVSFESLPEEAHSPGSASSPVTPTVIRNATRSPRHRPSSIDITRRAARKSQMRPIDEQREAKRKKIINEFYETEKSYVDGLDLIYSHFLTPIIASLDTPQQLLDRNELTSVFSNFIDIWNLHRSFYTSFTAFLDTSTSAQPENIPPPLSPVLFSHFPYLSMYTPFVTSFSDALASYAQLLNTHPAFSAFIARQEADPRCGKLKFRDWLLTIVQRCPRYLLLLKDLIGCTDTDDPEYNQLTAVLTLVSKITSSLNASLHTHAQTLALLALQRNTANLPFRLITPGRTFLKRTALLQLEGSVPREREFLLFSDCIIWLANADGVCISDKWESAASGNGGGPALVRTHSKSDAGVLMAVQGLKRKESVLKLVVNGSPKKKVARHGSNVTDERWVYKGSVDLVDIEVVVSAPREPWDERRLELLSPQQSFAVYAESEAERDEWCMAIRNAKESLLVSFNVTQPNSTLTSSSSTNHLRRTLQALPYSPEVDERNPKRGRVDHFVPAIWIPDGKAQSCMRCGRPFGWRRRRHHCRLCGRCVCNGCSNKTFYIVDDTGVKDSSKPARACDACYDTVFPLLDSPQELRPGSGTAHSHLTLSGLKSMPSLVMSDRTSASPSALMHINLESPNRTSVRFAEENGSPDSPSPVGAIPAIRIKPASRPRSYIQILENFQEHGQGEVPPSVSRSASRLSRQGVEDASFLVDERDEDEEVTVSGHGGDLVDSPSGATVSLPSTPLRESTVRKHKRFSLPAVAVHTSPVTARPNLVGEGNARRFSLVLSRGGTVGQSASRESSRNRDSGSGLKEGLAAGRLSELLGKVRGL